MDEIKRQEGINKLLEQLWTQIEELHQDFSKVNNAIELLQDSFPYVQTQAQTHLLTQLASSLQASTKHHTKRSVFLQQQISYLEALILLF
jgi:hypothetical protein